MSKFRKAAGLLMLAACCLLALYILFSAAAERLRISRLHSLKAARAALPAAAPLPLSGNPDGLNLNAAGREQLMTLPGISASLADAIIAQRSIRPFRFLEDLKVIKGIGDKRVEALRDVAYAGVLDE